MAELKFFGYLADIVGTRRKELVLDRPTALREILPESFPEDDITVLIDKRVGNLDSVLEDENSVTIMPILSGG